MTVDFQTQAARSRAPLRAVGPLLLLALTGCVEGFRSGTSRDQSADCSGRTYYIDGAGNWGYGVLEVQEGLRRAGYRGNVINFRWSATFNPALDQTIGRVAARVRAKELAGEIGRYLEQYPDSEVHIIALSAGTGVAVWACENLAPPARVHNLILLGSSLSSSYPMRKALAHIERGVWVYYSPYDQILSGPVKALGTIDGELVADSAGLVGLHPRDGSSDKIHNIGWTARWESLGWGGSHTDATSEPFVRLELAKHVLASGSASPATQPAVTARAPATRPALAPRPAVTYQRPPSSKIRATSPRARQVVADTQ